MFFFEKLPTFNKKPQVLYTRSNAHHSEQAEQK